MRQTNHAKRTFLPGHLPELHREQCTKPSESSAEQALTEADFSVLQRFLQRARDLANDSVIRLLYRGERKDKLGDRLCQDSQEALGKIAAALFYFGEKGKHFWDSCLRREGETPQWPKMLEDIDDLSIESFGSILSQLRRILICFADKVPAVQAFVSDHPEFRQAVTSNQKELMRRFETLDAAGKRLVRDTYHYVLHTYSRREQKVASPFVSFTPDYSKARKYARDENSQEDCNSCVICAFLPGSFEHQAVSSETLKQRLSGLNALGFPAIDRGFFPEKEVALLGGAFPHCIYGIYQLKPIPGRFCVNPKALTPDLEDKVWKDGFALNQDDFDRRILKETKYSSAVERSDGVMKELKWLHRSS